MKFDVIIIGAGSGSKLARPIAKLGKKVAYIEKGKLGGTCLNHGCIPSKMLLEPCFKLDEIIYEAEKFNININGEPALKIDIDKKELVSRVCNDIDADSSAILPLLQNQPFLTIYQDSCHFIGPKRVFLVEKNMEITADIIYIACGCRANIPDLDGLQGTPFLTYKEVLRLETTPESIICIGGGYIATELGYMLSRTGSRVEFLIRNQFLSSEDPEIQAKFTEAFTLSQKVTLNAIPLSVSYDKLKSEFTVTISINGQIEKRYSEALFIATGVKSNADLLCAEKAGIKIDSKGFIEIDEHLQTNIDGIYAFGDVTGKNLFKHSANYEGEYLFKTHWEKGIRMPISYPPMPHAVFTNPMIAGVGLTEPEAKKQFRYVVVGTADYTDVAMGNAIMDEIGFCKLLFDTTSRQLIGAHIIGKEASTLIHMCIAFLKFKATIDDMDDTIYIHPALSEVIRAAVRSAKRCMNKA